MRFYEVLKLSPKVLMLEKQDDCLHIVSVDPDDLSGGLEITVALPGPRHYCHLVMFEFGWH